ncbi:hypothetical protein Thiowin_02424 [Thiorhodovibrio winogradskyi]|uniref:Uncharacterized protein n=1 Tax=Thiorhodovibrio winogradskyi TaxID=77007 RepID=A0ABZ0SA44_9GAMM|nr:hypothetical protein [Thiorhodovibrio winogradskyi]
MQQRVPPFRLNLLCKKSVTHTKRKRAEKLAEHISRTMEDVFGRCYAGHISTNAHLALISQKAKTEARFFSDRHKAESFLRSLEEARNFSKFSDFEFNLAELFEGSETLIAWSNLNKALLVNNDVLDKLEQVSTLLFTSSNRWKEHISAVTIDIDDLLTNTRVAIELLFRAKLDTLSVALNQVISEEISLGHSEDAVKEKMSNVYDSWITELQKELESKQVILNESLSDKLGELDYFMQFTFADSGPVDIDFSKIFEKLNASISSILIGVLKTAVFTVLGYLLSPLAALITFVMSSLNRLLDLFGVGKKRREREAKLEVISEVSKAIKINANKSIEKLNSEWEEIESLTRVQLNSFGLFADKLLNYSEYFKQSSRALRGILLDLSTTLGAQYGDYNLKAVLPRFAKSGEDMRVGSFVLIGTGSAVAARRFSRIASTIIFDSIEQSFASKDLSESDRLNIKCFLERTKETIA